TAPGLSDAELQRLRATMSADVGVVRDAAGLTRALAVIEALERVAGPALPLIAARLIAEAALARRESRGGHFRRDYPATAAQARHSRVSRAPAAALEAGLLAEAG
ncbi:MAG: L-aspartate oxidase, partial [Brevundimonas sp.]